MQNTSSTVTAAAEVTAADREVTTAWVDITQGTLSQGTDQAASGVPPTAVIIIAAAVTGSILLILVGGAVASLTVCLVLCRRRAAPLHKGVIAAVQGIIMSESTHMIYTPF
jgi:hypothetical protein